VNIDDTLAALSVAGILSALLAFWIGIIPLHKANGTRPTLQAVLAIAGIEFLWAGMMGYNAIFNRDVIPEGGIPLLIAVFARLKPTIVSSALIFMGIRLSRQNH